MLYNEGKEIRDCDSNGIEALCRHTSTSHVPCKIKLSICLPTKSVGIHILNSRKFSCLENDADNWQFRGSAVFTNL